MFGRKKMVSGEILQKGIAFCFVPKVCSGVIALADAGGMKRESLSELCVI